MGGWKLDDITAGMQGAVFDTSSWRGLLGSLSAEVGAAGAVLFSTDARHPTPLSSPDLEELSQTYGEEGWHERDLRYRGVPTMERRGVMTDLDCVTPDEMESSDYYQTFLAKQNRRWFAGVGFRAGDDLWCLSIQRSISSFPFSPDELQRLKYLWRPLTDAAMISKLLGEIRTFSTVEALDLVSKAAIVCDSEGRVVRMNEQAERLVGENAVPGHRISWRHLPSAARFNALLDSACTGSLGPSTQPRAVDVFNDKMERLTVRAVCLSEDIRCMFARSSILLLLKPKPPSVEEHLQENVGLTRSEVAVAMALFHGRSSSEIAEDRSITANTVRQQLKTIYSKTETGTQAQLVSYISRIMSASSRQ